MSIWSEGTDSSESACRCQFRYLLLYWYSI